MKELLQNMFVKYFTQMLDLKTESKVNPDFYPMVILYQNLAFKQKKNLIKAMFI